MRHIYGDGVPEDNDRAFILLTKAYRMGHVEATYNLGICYHYGFGTNVNLEKAYTLYLQSAEAGYGKGMELFITKGFMWRKIGKRPSIGFTKRPGLVSLKWLRKQRRNLHQGWNKLFEFANCYPK